MKTAVVDVGGGMRGIYAAGVLDYCMDRGITFDLGIGVSAGSANIASFIARQRGRNYPFYTDYPHRREYMGLHNLLHDHAYLNLDYVYGSLSRAEGENPLDYSAMLENPMEFIAVATNAETGETVYFTKTDMHTRMITVSWRHPAPFLLYVSLIESRGWTAMTGPSVIPCPFKRPLTQGVKRLFCC